MPGRTDVSGTPASRRATTALRYAGRMVIELLPAASDAELAQMIETRNLVDPHPMTVAAFLAERAVALKVLNVNAMRDGSVAGAASLGWGTMGVESKTAFLEIWVLPDHRRHGVGSALYRELAVIAAEAGMTHLRGEIVEGHVASLRFAEQRGFQVQSRGQIGSLALPAPPRPPVPAPSGTTSSSLADQPDLVRGVYDLSMRVRPEIPALKAEPIPSFEAWRGSTIDDPGYLPSLSPIALDDKGRVIGSMDVYDGADGSVFIGMTAVDPESRRRGIGRYLKEELARRATAAGFERIETYNDGSNDRIRNLNIDLGYVYLPPVLMVKGPIDGSGGQQEVPHLD